MVKGELVSGDLVRHMRKGTLYVVLDTCLARVMSDTWTSAVVYHEDAGAMRMQLYISGPYTVGKNAGRRGVCDLATARVLGYLADDAEPRMFTRDEASFRQNFERV